MKKASLLIALLSLAWCATAQEQPAAEQPEQPDRTKLPVSIKLYGFVRNYFNVDSRKTYTVVGGEYNMIPYDSKWNEDHTEDLNDVPHAQLQALSTRFGLNLSGPDVLGWSTSGKVEADFGGFGSNNMVLRLRQAFVKLSREHAEILVGQTWHPMSGDIMPEVLGMAAGAPFRPHSRTPQVRAMQSFGAFSYTAALLYQLQYMNNGPTSASDPKSTNSIEFAHNAIWPEAFLGAGFKHGGFYSQVGIDVQVLRPRTHALIDTVTKKVDETVSSFSPTVYAQYVGGKLSVKFRALLAQNTSHLNQLCGYAVSSINTDGSWNYTPIRNGIGYFNVAYGKTLRGNLFLGYMQNIGATSNLHDFGEKKYRIYMKGGENFTHLDAIFRIAPSLSYNVKAFNIGIEYEWTACNYGDIAPNGSIEHNENLHQVVNHRICALMKYNF